ncbi:hypothetical protein FRB97_006208 [Tulasnella sp. 331]|nr:hypothetical protein FRB97_006208 [Tulasnella sp. 331]
MYRLSQITLDLELVLLYQGGLFKVHQDSQKATIDTLLIGLPASFEEGRFLLQHGANQATIDWSSKHGQLRGDALSFPWTFFSSGVGHEISQVAPGHRLTLAYAIYSSRSFQYYQGPVDTNLEVGERPSSSGSDAVLSRVSIEFKLEIQVKAAYSEELYTYEARTPKIEPSDEFSYVEVNEHDTSYVLPTADDFSGIDGLSILMEGSEGLETKKMGCCRANSEPRLIWTMPDKFRLASTFARYGNEPDVDHSYVSAALWVDLPPVVNGRRRGY